MTATFTSSSRLLVEIRAAARHVRPGFPLHSLVQNHFSVGQEISWQTGALRFQRLVERVQNDLDVLPVDRAQKYHQTLSQQVSLLINPAQFHVDSQQTYNQVASELVIERLENFDDTLRLANRALTLEEGRVDFLTSAIQELIAELGVGTTEIDAAVEGQLRHLLRALERYELFGPEGVKDAVSSLMGEAITSSVMFASALTPEVRARLKRVFEVGKAALDGFVYLAAAGQAIEWSGHFTRLLE